MSVTKIGWYESWEGVLSHHFRISSGHRTLPKNSAQVDLVLLTWINICIILSFNCVCVNELCEPMKVCIQMHQNILLQSYNSLLASTIKYNGCIGEPITGKSISIHELSVARSSVCPEPCFVTGTCLWIVFNKADSFIRCNSSQTPRFDKILLLG